MPPSEAENVNHLPSLISNYMRAKESLWEVYLCKKQNVWAYYNAVEQYKDHFFILRSALEHIDRARAVAPHQKIACHSMIDALLKESNTSKYFIKICCQYLRSEFLTAEEDQLVKSLRKYCASLPIEPNMVTKRFFSKKGVVQEITFTSCFSVVDGVATHRYPRTAIVKLPRNGTSIFGETK